MAKAATKDAKPEAARESQESPVEVHEAELPEAADTGDKSGTGQIDILLDTAVPVMARLGETEMQVRDLLQMGPGSVVQLDKQAGEPVDLFLRGIRFATGTLVVVGDRLGVKIKEILSADQDQPEEDS